MAAAPPPAPDELLEDPDHSTIHPNPHTQPDLDLTTTIAEAPPVIPDELVEEILLGLPPDDPAHLLRASIVCKDWAGIVSRPAFRRRLHELHPTPPVLGFLRDWTTAPLPHFIPTTASSFSPAAPSWHWWRAQDCRHGRALFFSMHRRPLELLVWEPTTGAQQRVSVPVAFGGWNNDPMGAVLCAADGCDHRDCLGGPFRVVFSFSDLPEDFDPEEEEWVRSVTVYSSETGTWGELTSVHSEFNIDYQRCSSVLVGSSLLYFRGRPEHGSITEYDLAEHALTVFEPPGDCSEHGCDLMLTEDGGLGVIENSCNEHIKLWTWEAIGDTDAVWMLSRVIDLYNLLPIGTRSDGRYGGSNVVRFVEGANVILVRTAAGLFTIELQSELVRKICKYRAFSDLIPVVGFYTPRPRGEHQNLLALKPSEEAGGGEEKTVDQAQLLFDKGSNAIKEGDFVNTFESISHGHNMRVPCYGEVALEDGSSLNIYGCTLLPKAAPNEESVMGTSSKEDNGNSTTSGSNVECAPPSEKDLDERILKQQDEEGSVNTNKKKKKEEQACQNRPEDIDPDVDATLSFRGFRTSKM